MRVVEDRARRHVLQPVDQLALVARAMVEGLAQLHAADELEGRGGRCRHAGTSRSSSATGKLARTSASRRPAPSAGRRRRHPLAGEHVRVAAGQLPGQLEPGVGPVLGAERHRVDAAPGEQAGDDRQGHGAVGAHPRERADVLGVGAADVQRPVVARSNKAPSGPAERERLRGSRRASRGRRPCPSPARARASPGRGRRSARSAPHRAAARAPPSPPGRRLSGSTRLRSHSSLPW